MGCVVPPHVRPVVKHYFIRSAPRTTLPDRLWLQFSRRPNDAFRVFMVWVYDRTGSLLVAILMHASLLACTIICAPAATGVAFLVYSFAVAAALWIVVAAVAVANGGKLSRGENTSAIPVTRNL